MGLFYLTLGLVAGGILAALILALVISFSRERAAVPHPEAARLRTSPRPRRTGHVESRAPHLAATQLMHSRLRANDLFRRS
jgi:hypothetical protein